MSYKIAFVAIKSCLSSSIMGSIDLFTAANVAISTRGKVEPPMFECVIVSESGNTVKAFNGYHLEVSQSWSSLKNCDLIIIPGFSITDTTTLMNTLSTNQSLTSWLRKQAKKDTLIAGHCSGNFFLAEAGLLNGRPATTAWWLTDFLSENYPKILVQPDAILTSSGKYICSGTAMSWLELSIYLIEKLAGNKVAKLTSRYMLVDTSRNTQAPYRLPVPKNQQDRFILKATRFIDKNLHKKIHLENLAEKMNVSTRTLVRKFKKYTGYAPLTYIQKQRIEAGKVLLEDSDLALAKIVSLVGYQDSSSFRRLFKRETGLSPYEYRQRFTKVSVY